MIQVGESVLGKAVAGNDADWFEIEVPSNSIVDFRISFTALGGELNYIVRDNFTLLGNGTSIGDGLLIGLDNQNNTDFTFYIQLEPATGGCNVYDVTSSLR